MEQKSDSYLVFQINEELFALNVQRVLKILELQTLTKVPQSPPFVKGVINHQGNVLPVVDTRAKFGLETIENTRETCIIVVEINFNDGSFELGMIVDRVKQVYRFDESNIIDFPDLGKRFNSSLIQGVMRLNDFFVMILDIDNLFSRDDTLFIKTELEN